MKAARMSGYPIDVFSGVRYYIDDHKRGAFELGAPTMDVLDVTDLGSLRFQWRAATIFLVHQGTDGIAGLQQLRNNDAPGLSSRARHDNSWLDHVRLLFQGLNYACFQ